MDNTNEQIKSNNDTAKFNISLDKKTNKWLWIIFISLLLILLLNLTDLSSLLIKSIIVLIPLAIAFSIAMLLNPCVQYLTKKGIHYRIAKYIIFILVFIIGAIIITILLWLIINQFWGLVQRLLGNSTTIKYLLDQFHDSKDLQKVLLSNIFYFNYDSGSNSFILNTNIEWDQLVPFWRKILQDVWEQSKIKNPDSLSTLLSDLQTKFGITWSSISFEINYMDFLKNNHSVSSFKSYFSDLFSYIDGYVLKNQLNDINMEVVNLQVINEKVQGFKIPNDLGAIYHLIFKLSDVLGNFLPAKIIYNFVNTIHNQTNSEQLTKIFISKYLIILTSILYSIILIIIITFTVADEQKKISKFIKTKMLPGKSIEDKEKVALAFKSSLIGYSKGIAIDMSYMFTGILLMMILAGYAAGGESYKSSFVILAIFMTFCNLVPYIGPFIGIIPIAIVGVLDALTINNSSSSNDILPWVPLIVGVFGAFLVQFIENIFIYPKIFGKVTKLHPATILVGISFFGAVFGIIGMILAVPVISTFKAVGNDVYNKNYGF